MKIRCAENLIDQKIDTRKFPDLWYVMCETKWRILRHVLCVCQLLNLALLVFMIILHYCTLSSVDNWHSISVWCRNNAQRLEIDMPITVIPKLTYNHFLKCFFVLSHCWHTCSLVLTFFSSTYQGSIIVSSISSMTEDSKITHTIRQRTWLCYTSACALPHPKIFLIKQIS